MGIFDWSDMMGQTVIHRQMIDTDDYGKPIYGSDQTYKGRVNYRQKLVRSFSGQEVMADGEVWILGTPVISPDDQIELSDTTTPVLLGVDRPSDEKEIHHTKVFFNTGTG